MLKILFRDEIDSNIKSEKDIEKLFSQLKLHGTEQERKVIEQIDKGKYLDEISFIDRFGYKLYVSELSTGCKAALCVLNFPDKIIDLLECGNNARDVIINTCKEGTIITSDNAVTIKDLGQEINVCLDEYRLTSVKRLNQYVNCERPFKPNLSTGGIECIQ